MSSRRRWFRLLTLTAFWMSLACVAMLAGCAGGVTLGPTIQREFILVKPGQPIRILSNATVRGQRTGDEAIVEKQAIGGWVAMPPEHWEVVKAQLEAR